MTTVKQLAANRQNAQFSTGPVTEDGKRRARRNAVRHGLTAETVIGALEDAEDYHAFEMAVAADYDAQSATERELVLRLASVLWRLRRATAMEAGLFEIQARQLLQFRRLRREQPVPLHGTVSQWRESQESETFISVAPAAEQPLDIDREDIAHDLTATFLRLCNLASFPLDRLSRYEASLWRQACQIMFLLQSCGRSKRWAAFR
jgi:hypothetical protein